MSLLVDAPVATPRRVVPPAPQNLADDAIFLASAYGLTPDPWQADILHGWLGLQADGKWAASRAGLSVPRQNGKNAALEVRELFGMIDLGERFLHTAHEVKTARKAFQRLLEFFDNRAYPELGDLVKEIRRTNGQEAILLRNGGGVEFVARTKGSGRGFTVDVLVLDEAQELSDETYAALLPTISSAPLGNPQQILTGTPPGPSTNGEVFARTRDSALGSQPGRLCWLEWSADPDDDMDDPATWSAANPAIGMRPNAISLDAVIDERAAMDETTFSRERLGMWQSAATATVIDMQHWGQLAAQHSTVLDPVCFAVDVTPDRSAATVSIAGRSTTGKHHVEVVDNRRGTGWVVERVAELVKRWSPVAVVLDASGPAGSLVARLNEAGVDPLITSSREMGQACGTFYDLAVEGDLVHLNQPALNSALGAARKRSLGDAWAWHRKDSNADISPLVAVTLALFGHLSVKKVTPAFTPRRVR